MTYDPNEVLVKVSVRLAPQMIRTVRVESANAGFGRDTSPFIAKLLTEILPEFRKLHSIEEFTNPHANPRRALQMRLPEHLLAQYVIEWHRLTLESRAHALEAALACAIAQLANARGAHATKKGEVLVLKPPSLPV